MPSESFKSPPSPEKGPASKAERLAQAFAHLATLPPASTAEEALKIVRESVDTIEFPLFDAGIKDIMTVRGFDEMQLLQIRGRKDIYFQNLTAHTLFISKNGAIDIRRFSPENEATVEKISKNPHYAFDTTKMTLAFQKPDSNGKNVWDVTAT